MSAASYHRLKQDLAADLEQATILELSPAVIDRTIYCLEHAPLRALDAVQLASAMEARCQLFITADRRQCDAASLVRLKAEMVGGLS